MLLVTLIIIGTNLFLILYLAILILNSVKNK